MPPTPRTPLRLTLISHAMTDALRHARFPLDEPITDAARNSLANNIIGTATRLLTAPERRAAETAAGLSQAVEGATSAEVEPSLADLDHGAWAGRDMADLPEEDLLRWLTDPAAAPHGGEPLTALIERVGAWLAELTEPGSRVVAVTHPAVIRAAVLHTLGAPASAFWRIDIAPATMTVLHGRAERWTLRTTSAPLSVR